MRRVACTLFILLLSLASQIGLAQEAPELDAEFKKDILYLLKITGSEAMAVQMGSAVGGQVFDAVVNQQGEVSEEVRAVAMDEMEKILTEEMGKLMEEIVPLYAKYYTHDEIKELVTFYESPIGQKTISVLPQLMQESMVIGQEWGTRIGPEISERFTSRLQAEGLIPAEEEEGAAEEN